LESDEEEEEEIVESLLPPPLEKSPEIAKIKAKLSKDLKFDPNYASKLSKCNIMTLEELALDESAIVGRKG